MSELTKTLCNMIKGLREKEGASLEAFSEKLGISKTSLQNIERGGANPTLETVEQVADALGVSPLVLLAGDYDTEEFRIAWLLLRLLGGFEKLSEKEQREAIKAFNLLVETLSKK